MKIPLYVVLLRILRSLVILCLSITHLTSFFENLFPDFISVVSNVLPENYDDSVKINNVNKKIDKALDTAFQTSKFMANIVGPVATLTLGGVAIATVVKVVPTPQAKTIVATAGIVSMFVSSVTVPAIKALKGSSDKGNGGNTFHMFSMNVVQSDSSLFEQCSTGAHITIFFLELLVIALSVELFKRVLFHWISKLKNLPKPIANFVLKSVNKLQSISAVYVAVIIGIIWLNLFNLTVFLRYLQVFLPKAENAALLNTYLYYGLILTLVYFLLTILVVVILFGNSILTGLSKLWFLLEFQIVHMLGRSNQQKATQARLLAESNKARQYRLIIDKNTLLSRLFLAILLFSMWVVSLFLDHYYTLFSESLEKMIFSHFLRTLPQGS